MKMSLFVDMEFGMSEPTPPKVAEPFSSATDKSCLEALRSEMSLGFPFTSPYCEALELVLSRCMEKRWLLLLWRQGAWASLKNPQAHADGVCLLTSVLLRNQLVTRGVIWALSQWLNSPSGNLQLTATAFFAEVRQQEGKEGFRGLLLENCCSGCLFLKEEGARRERHHPMDPMDPRFYEARSRGVP
ncbi:uncharacterized protein ACIBXB_007794 isoform 1-T1 [Morphnus guianensis]